MTYAPKTISAHGVSYEIISDPMTLIGQRIWETDGPYEPWLLEDIYKRSREWEGGCAVDVGAHIGNHTLWMNKICDLAVVAFEPLMVEELRTNVWLNHASAGIRIEECALGAAGETANDLGMRVLTEPGAERGPGTAEGRLEIGVGQIPVKRMDSFDLHNVRLIKVDVEGMEPDVLRGAAATIERSQPVIYAESPDQAAHDRLNAVLNPYGYQKTARFKRGTPVDVWERR